jgi:pimeloyl-ACP methyl ester carboxylesterase
MVHAPDSGPATPPAESRSTEQTRARYPDETGVIERVGVRVAWERYGDGSPTLLLLPTWSIIHSRHWKGQIPYLARHFRVVTFDGRGNGRSDRPTTAAAYDDTEFAADAIAVLDATGTDRAIIAGLSMGAGYALQTAVRYPDRVAGAIFVGSSVGLGEPIPRPGIVPFDEVPPAFEGWSRYGAAGWRYDWPAFVEFFFSQVFNELHSTKQIEDAVDWACDTDAETIITAEQSAYMTALGSAAAWEPVQAEPEPPTASEREPAALGYARLVRCPSLVIHGDADVISGASGGRRLAAALGAQLVILAGSGHDPLGRDPVKVNLLFRDFVRRIGQAAS